MADELNHVVCIDDEKDILDIARLCLETIGKVKVTTFSGGKEALSELETLHPDLVLVDWLMPEMSGSAVLAAIMQMPALKNTPVVFLTARVQPSEVREYLDLGAAGIVPKPFDPMQLANQIKDIWKQFHHL